jgi:hypothetical protein
MRVHGRCHCGSIRYEGDADPARVTACHCTDCQMLTGSAYRVSVPVPRESFRIAGQPATYVKVADSGARRVHAFCGQCGSPVYSSAIADPASFTLRVGCLDERAELPPRKQQWCRSELPWVRGLGDAPAIERQ